MFVSLPARRNSNPTCNDISWKHSVVGNNVAFHDWPHIEWSLEESGQRTYDNLTRIIQNGIGNIRHDMNDNCCQAYSPWTVFASNINTKWINIVHTSAKQRVIFDKLIPFNIRAFMRRHSARDSCIQSHSIRSACHPDSRVNRMSFTCRTMFGSGVKVFLTRKK